jgi:hypothetical protein
MAPLTHKFAKRNCVEIFTTNAPDPLHWTQNSYFQAFRTFSLLHESRCKTGRIGAINAQVRYTKLRRKILQRTHLIHSVGPKIHDLVHFRPFPYSMTIDAKQAELVALTHKFANEVAPKFFATNAPDPLHWTQNSYFGTFRTISLPHESGCTTGRTGATNAQVR